MPHKRVRREETTNVEEGLCVFVIFYLPLHFLFCIIIIKSIFKVI